LGKGIIVNISDAKAVKEEYKFEARYGYGSNPIGQEHRIVEGNFKKENSIKSLAIQKVNRTLRNLLLLLVVASFAGYYFAMVSEYNLNNLSHQISTINDENAELENDLNRLKSLHNVDTKVSQNNMLKKAGQVMQVAAVGTVAPEIKKVKVSSNFEWAIGY